MKKSVLLLFVSFGYVLSAQVSFVKNFGDSGFEQYLTKIQNATSGYVGIGQGRLENQQDLDLMFYQLNGDLEIEQTIQFERPGIQETLDLMSFSDGSYIVAATTDERLTNRDDLLFLGLNANAEVIWEEILGSAYSDVLIASCLTTEDKAVFLIQESDDLNEISYRLLSFESGGGVGFNIALNWAVGSSISSCTPTSDGGLLVGGNQNDQAHIARYSNTGELVWSNNIPEPWSSTTELSDLIYDEVSDQILVSLNEGVFSQYFLGLDATAENVLFEEELFSFATGNRLVPLEYEGQSYIWMYEKSTVEIWRKASPNQYVYETDFYLANINGIEGFVDGPTTGLFVGGDEIVRVDKDTQLEQEEFSLDLDTQLSTEEFRSFVISPSGEWFVSSAGNGSFEFDSQNAILKLDNVGSAIDTFTTTTSEALTTNPDIALLNDHIVQVSSVKETNAEKYSHVLNIYNQSGELQNTLEFEEENPMASYASSSYVAALSDGTFFALIEGKLISDPFIHLIKADVNGTLLDTFDLTSQNIYLIRNIKSLSNDDVIIIGRDLDTHRLKVIKLDKDGSVVWNKNYYEEEQIIGYGISESPDGSKIAISGRIISTPISYVYWAELDFDGNLLNEHLYEESGTFTYPFIHYNSMGEIIIQATIRDRLANLDEEEHALGYWKFNEDGELIDATKYYPPYYMTVWESQIIENDYMALVGREKRANNIDAFIMVLDANGTLTSTNEVFESLSNFGVSPNPSKGLCNVQLDNAYRGTIRLELFDAQGQQIFTKEDQKTTTQWQFEFTRANLPSGYYTVRLTTSEGSMARLWIKQ